MKISYSQADDTIIGEGSIIMSSLGDYYIRAGRALYRVTPEASSAERELASAAYETITLTVGTGRKLYNLITS